MIENDHQNYVTQRQHTYLKTCLEAIKQNPDKLPQTIHGAQVAGIQSMIDDLRQQMEDYTRRLIDGGVIW